MKERRGKRQVKKGWRCYEQKRTQVTLAGGTLKPELEPAVCYGLRGLVLKFTSVSPVARQESGQACDIRQVLLCPANHRAANCSLPRKENETNTGKIPHPFSAYASSTTNTLP